MIAKTLHNFAARMRLSRRLLGRMGALPALAICVYLSGSDGAQPLNDSFDATPAALEVANLENFENPAALLTAADRALYRQIFDLQNDGEWDAADALIAELDDPLLLGHVQFQRYMHPTAYRSSYAELAGWLERYAAHPGAVRVHRLALRRRPAEAAAPPVPQRRRLVSGSLYQKRGQPFLPRLDQQAARGNLAAMRETVRRGDGHGAIDALVALTRTHRFGPLTVDIMRTRLAEALLYAGDVRLAKETAALAAMRSGETIPAAAWIAGLAAWRAGEWRAASHFFRAVAERDDIGSWRRSAAAFWAARALGRLSDDKGRRAWLQRAAASPTTFYGLLAQRTLDRDAAFNWSMPRYDAAAQAALAAHPAGRRALALIEAGQRHLAQVELLRLHPSVEPDLTRPILAAAERFGLAQVAYRFGHLVSGGSGERLDAALYPVPRWRGAGRRASIDRALIFAIMRQESRFDQRARSHAGATGLMQLMPVTVRHVTGGQNLPRAALLDPMTNVALGQSYIAELLERRYIQGNLFKLLTAYNAGPSRLLRWRRVLGAAADDPLTFIETLPVAETRAYIERVLTNLWIYRMRLGQATPSLDRLAQGAWPRYQHLDKQPLLVAEHDAH